MLAVMAVLIAAKRTARLLCERSRASLAAEFFARAPKSLRKGIAVYIAVAKGFRAAGAGSGDVKLAVSGAGGSRTWCE